uniref:Uncharacterized protein n=1 Tax=Rhizophora mucronata TaxID=61149 RepID=A0A2P2N7S8_RHIMU
MNLSQPGENRVPSFLVDFLINRRILLPTSYHH